jgi:hypothetical protein
MRLRDSSILTGPLRHLFGATAVPRRTLIACEWFALPVLAIAVLASLSGCALSAASNGQPPSLQGTLSASPLSVSFGSVAVGSTTTQSATLSNASSASVTVTQATISSNCFSVLGMAFPMTVAPGQSVPVQIQFAPQQAGNISATLSVASNATDGTVSVTLTGTGIAPTLSLSPATLAFGDVSVGGTATDNITVTNTGNGPLTISSANLSGSAFSMSGLSTPLTLGINQSSTFSVQFAPNADGNVIGGITFVSNAPGSPMTMTLSGTGEAGATLTASPSTLAFGSVLIGDHPSQTVTLKNTGNSNISISQMTSIGSAFAVSGMSLPVTLAGGQSASLSVTFTPTASGTESGSVTVTSTASDPSLVVSLEGTGASPQPQLAVSPASLSFGSIAVDSSSSQPVTLSNTGTGALTISAASASSAGFSVSGFSLPATLNPGQNAALNVTFAPRSAGSTSGTLSIVSNAPDSPALIPLSGTGAQGQLSASPANVSFGSVLVGGNAPQTITLTNTGGVPVAISNASVVGAAFSLSGLSTPVTLNAGASTAFAVTFAPTAAGNVSGSVSITSNASDSTLVVGLAGTGTQGQLSSSPSTVTFGNVTTGTNTSQTVTLNNSGSASITITAAVVSPSVFTVSGLTVPLTIGAGTNSSFTVGFAPTAAGSVSGTLILTSNAPNSPMTISLAGTGVSSSLQLSVTPATLNFGNVQVGSSGTQTATLTNTGNSSVIISQIAVSGSGYTASGVGAGQALLAGQSVPITVTFTPTATGGAIGSVTITSNASNSPTTIALAAGSYLVDLSWTGSTSAVIGYNVYRGTVSGGPYTIVNSSPVAGTSYTDISVQLGQTYYYVVTAVSPNGVESVYSNQATAPVPTP